VTIVSSRGSIWGYDQQSVTILDERGGFVNSAPDTNDTRLIALLAALSADCVPKLSAATLGLTPELMHALTPAQIQFGQVSPAQRKWYDTTLDQTALERTVERYYAQDPEPEDAQYARVRVTVSDSTGVVMSASSTAQQQLLLPWYVTHRGLATCLSWDPRLSRAISAYLTGDLTDRAAGSTLPEAIASWYVTLNRGQWALAAAREQFGGLLDHIPSQYALVSAAECSDGTSPCNPNFLSVVLRAKSGPPNLHFEAELALDAHGRVTGWDAFIAAIPVATERLSAFPPIASLVDKPDYLVGIDLPPYGKRKRALEWFAECKGADLIPDASGSDVYAVDVTEPGSKYDAGFPSSQWLVPPDGSAILWRYSGHRPLHLNVVPMTNGLGLVAAQFSPAGRLIKGYTCP
jgi:hypothetical protein